MLKARTNLERGLAHYGREVAKASESSVTPFQDYFRKRDAQAVLNVFSNVLGTKLETGIDKYIIEIFFGCIDQDGDCDKHPNWLAYNKPH
jgi:hypothetical protein